MLHHIHCPSIGVLFLALLLAVPATASAASIGLRYYDGDSWLSCADGGSTVVSESVIGKTIFIPLNYRNSGATPIGLSGFSATSMIGCEGPFYHLSDRTLGPATTAYITIGIRPTEATWSFAITINLTGDSTSTYTHTFSAGDASPGSGPQAETARWSATEGWVHQGIRTYYDASTLAIVGEPMEFRVRLSNRSALQTLNITPPGWGTTGVGGFTSYCTYTVDYQPPSTLATDEGWMSIIRVIPTEATVIRAVLGIGTDDPVQSWVDINGNASIHTKLRVFFGGQQIATNTPTILIPATTIGEQKDLHFIIKNDESVSISFSHGISYNTAVGCSASTSVASISLAPGAEANFVVKVTPSSPEWICRPYVFLNGLSGRRTYWDLKNDGPASPAPTPTPSEDKTGNSADSKCGFGSGIGVVLLLIGSGLWVVSLGLRGQRLRPRTW